MNQLYGSMWDAFADIFKLPQACRILYKLNDNEMKIIVKIVKGKLFPNDFEVRCVSLGKQPFKIAHLLSEAERYIVRGYDNVTFFCI